jgi:hypothetical protein
MKNIELTASDEIMLVAATEPAVAGVRHFASPIAGLPVDELDGTELDSIIITLLEDIMRARRGENHIDMRYDGPDAGHAVNVALPPHPRRSSSAGAGTSGTIVIAEDDDGTRTLLDRVLTRAGFTVHVRKWATRL